MAGKYDPQTAGRSTKGGLQTRPGSEGVLWNAALATLTGLLMLASFPPFSMAWCAWFALVPLLYAVTRPISLWRSLWLGWLAGVVFTFCAENWIAHSMTNFGGLLTAVAYAVAFLFSSIVALFPAIFAVVMARLTRRFGPLGIAAAPVVWVATEWIRSLITGVTWNFLGISQVRTYSIARLAQYGGASLITFELAAAGTVVVLLIRSRDQLTRRLAAGVIFLMLLPALLPGIARIDEGKESSNVGPTIGIPVKVLGVQPDIPLAGSGTTEGLESGFEQLRALTLEGVRKTGSPDLIVWAESPLALFYENDASVRERVDGVAKETGAHIIANTITREDERYFNSVHVVSPAKGAKGSDPFRRYDKIRLVPFGEYVPWRAVLGRFVPAIVGDFTPGRAAVVNTIRLETEREGLAMGGNLEAPQIQIERNTRFVKVGSFICYEAAYPNLVRQFVNQGATLLVNVSNDGWFGNTAGAEQHLAHAMMRAIENNRDLVRVTNSGITALITADGRVVDALARSTRSSQAWQATARGGAKTFYTRHGDVFAMVCAVVSVLAIGFAIAAPQGSRSLR